MNENPLNNNERDPGHWDLRTILAKGRRVMEEMQNGESDDVEDEEEVAPLTAEALTRREALRRLAIGVGGVGVAVAGAKAIDKIVTYNKEQKEILERSDEFFAEVSGYETQVKLRFDEVLFVDKVGAPVSVVKMEDFEIDRNGESYLLAPGVRNEFGIVEGAIAGEWLDYIRLKLKEENPDLNIDLDKDSPRALTVHAQFNNALRDEEEPSLVNRIKNGSVATYEDIIRYFADKPVRGDENYTRSQYVESNIVFTNWDDSEKKGVHPAAAAELRRLVSGLCAQESNFNNGLVSASEAMGIFQILKEVWEKDYGLDVEEFKSLPKQVEVAGKHLSRMYARVQDKAGELAVQQLRVLHPDEEILQTEVLVPLTLNSYNAGPDRVGEAVRKYFGVPENRAKKLTGRDLFLDIADFADIREDGLLEEYRQYAREYVPRIYAKTAVLAEDK